MNKRLECQQILKNCLVCKQETELEYLQSFQEYTFYHCPKCDVVFSYPFENPGSEWYEDFQVCHKIGYPVAITWDHKMFFKDALCLGSTLLDVGCGSGYFIAEAQKRGYKVTGVDFDSNAISVGRNKFGLERLFCGSLNDFNKAYPNTRFDIVTFFGVLEHLDNPSEFLVQVKEVLNPGGYIAFTVPYRNRWPNFDFKEWWDGPPFHLTRWSEKAIRNILAKKRFQSVKIVKGRSQYDDVIDWLRGKILKRGVVSKIVHEADIEKNKNRQQLLMRKAVLLGKVSKMAYSVLKVPINVGLFMVRATGKSMYVRAQKNFL